MLLKLYNDGAIGISASFLGLCVRKPFPYAGEAAKEPERKRKEASTQSAVEIYREIIKDNIDYDILMGGMEMKGRSYPETPAHEYLLDIRAGLYLYSSTFFFLS